jgi:hypothetical protein
MPLASRGAALVLALACSAGAAAPLAGQGAPARPTDGAAEGATLPLVYDVEHTGAAFPDPAFPPAERLPLVRVLPDPFQPFAGGTRDASFAAWSRRRAEIQASIEAFEIGPKPDPSELQVTATYTADTLTVVVTRSSNGRSVTLRSPVILPAGAGPFAAVIGMAGGAGRNPVGAGSLPAAIFDSRGIARIPFFHDQVTKYREHGPEDPYFRLYPEHDRPGTVGQYSAWSWGVSRLIDGLQIAARAGTLPIDTRHLAVTGCSYAGKMALYAGALDERVALTIAQESGGGGAPAWRVSHGIEPDGTVEKTDNTNGAWFMQRMKEQFRGDEVYRLPHDHHELMALVAPRALLVTGNTDYLWLSNRAAYVTARAAQETYATLGIGDRFGFFIDGGHGHCQIPDSQRPAVEAFVDRFLLGRSVPTDVAVHPYPEFEFRQWMPWARP